MGSRPPLEKAYERFARDREAPNDPFFWVAEFFTREDRYRASIDTSLIDRPVGAQRKKNPKRRGAHSDAVAIAYARWDRPSIPIDEITREAVGTLSYQENFNRWTSERYPISSFERLSILTPRSLYSFHSGIVEVFDFADERRSVNLVDLIGLSTKIRGESEMESLVPAVFTKLYAEPDERTWTKPFILYGSSVRVRSPSR